MASPTLAGRKSAPPDHEGLQVVPREVGHEHLVRQDARSRNGVDSYLYPVTQQPTPDHEIAQVYRKNEIRRSPSTPDGGIHEELTVPRRHTAHRKLYWVIIAMLVLVIILAAILGGVLGSRAAHQHMASSPPATSTVSPGLDPNGAASSGPNGISRGFPAHGVRATTSLSADVNYAVAGGDNSDGGYLFFQADNGTVVFIAYGYDNTTGLVSLKSSGNVPIDAANGTSLSARVWNHWGATYFLHLIYIAPNGTLLDITLGTELNARWRSGNLSAHNFQTPLNSTGPGRRVALHHQISYIYGKDSPNAPGGSRLWVGGSDGFVHMYGYDFATGTWSAQYQNFTGLSAVGSLDSAYAGGFDNGWLALFGTDRKQTLAYQEQNFTGVDSPSGRGWPYGNGTYGSPVTTDQTASNGAFEVAWPYLYFETTDKKLGVQELSLSRDHWGNYNSALENVVTIMPGTDFDATSINYHTQLFYQDTSNSIAWRVMDGLSQGGQGHFVLDQSSGQWKDEH